MKFSISAFGVILGTGGVALASQTYLPELTIWLTYLLTVLFVLFTGLFVVKLILHPGVVKQELQDPGPGNFYGLQPISAVILGTLYKKLFPPTPVDAALLIYGAAVIIGLTVYLPYHFFANMNIEFAQLHGGWFITPVANILVTYAIFLFPLSQSTLAMALVYFGIGLMLFLLLLGVLFFRLLNHDLPPAELAPTNFIMLAPIGILIVDFLQIFSAVDSLFGASANAVAIVFATSLWGFGLWVILVNILLFVKYARSVFSFHLGWWSYVFPMASFALGTFALSKYLHPIGSASLVFYLSLIVVWASISIRSLLLLGRSILK